MATTDPLLREVDEAVRHDRMMAQWRRYRRPVITIAVAIVLFTLGMTQYRNYREAKAGQAMEALTVAQSLFADAKYAEAATSFADIAAHSQTKKLADIAHLWQGRALVQAGKKPEAIATLTDLAEHPRSDQHIWRDLACLRLVALDASKSACLAANDASPLAAQRTLTHAAQLWDENHIEESRALLETLINNPDTPASVRANAQLFLSVVALMPAKTPASPAAKG